MDLTGGLADKLPALIQSLLDGVKTDEATAISSFQTDLSNLLETEKVVVTQVLTALTAFREGFFADLDKRLDGLTLTSTVRLPAAQPGPDGQKETTT